METNIELLKQLINLYLLTAIDEYETLDTYFKTNIIQCATA